MIFSFGTLSSKNEEKWNLKFHFSGGNGRKNKAIKKETIINPYTGDIKERESFVDMLFSPKGYIMKYNNAYIKLFFDKELPKECTLTDCGKFYKLIKYIVGENQLLGYRSSKIKPLTAEKMSELFRCSERQTRKFIKKMKDMGIMKEILLNDMKWYAINPLYALKNKFLSVTAFIIFQDELIRELPIYAINHYMDKVQTITDKVEIKK